MSPRSEFESESEASPRLPQSRRGRTRAVVEIESRRVEEEESYESTSEDELKEEDLEVSPRRSAAVPSHNVPVRTGPLRLNTMERVQRVKGNPRFKQITAETLGRVLEQFDNDSVTPSVIVSASTAKPIPRRTRVFWDLEEENQLSIGVAKHGSSWSAILNDPELVFQDRTQVDLKDKWRNMTNKRAYSELPIRRFVLVNENHEPCLTEKGSYHIFNNRWPIDAATKVATKAFVYPEHARNTARIYLREVPAEGQEACPMVHVFDVSRRCEVAIGIPKFEGQRTAWVGYAKKVCSERLITRQACLAAAETLPAPDASRNAS